MFSVYVENGYVVFVGTNGGSEEITESEYNEILSIIHNRPTAPTGSTYKLRADTLEWELVELPPVEEQSEDADESDYIEALQDLGVEVN